MKHQEIGSKMRINPIQSRTKFETVVDEESVSFIKVIGTMSLTRDKVRSVLIKSRNKVFSLPLQNYVIEKEGGQLNDADKVFISVKFQEIKNNLVCNILSVLPLNQEEVCMEKSTDALVSRNIEPTIISLYCL